jgi:hypothetical protein
MAGLPRASNLTPPAARGCLLPADHNRFVASCAETRGLSSDYAEG